MMILRKSSGPAWPTRSFAVMFAAMGNARRLQALHHLEKGESTVNEMAEAIGLTQSSVSQHLAVLRRCNLVKTRRNAQTIFYSLDSDAMARVLALLNDIHSENSPNVEEPDDYPDHSL